MSGCLAQRFQGTCAVLVCAALLAACGGRSAEQSLAAAKAHIAKNESPAAIIELKNSLQAQPDLAEARFLLGKLLLEREDPAGAAIELAKAAALKYPPDQLIPALATAYRLTGESNKVVELDASAALTAPEAIARLKTQLAHAHAALGAPDAKVDETLALALRAKADHAPAQLLRARLLYSRRDPEASMRLVDEVLGRAPEDVDALTLKADMLVARRQGDAALALYAKALALRPADIAAHSGQLAHSLSKNDLAAAAVQLEAMKKARPTHPRTRYFDARLALQRGDMKEAAAQAQQLQKIAPEHPEILYLVGTVAMQTGEIQLAEQHARKLFTVAPELADSRRLLAAVFMRKSEPAKALETIQPLLRAGAADADALHMAGQAYMALGDFKRSEEAFSLAGQQGHIASRVALGLVKIARGDAPAGVAALESVAAADSGVTADLALIDAQLKLRNHPAALTAIERLKAKQPGKAQPLQMEGEVRLRMGDAAAARASFERALAAEPAYFPAVESLVALDLRESRPEQARARVDAVLKRDPADARALVALAALDERDGKPRQEVAATLAKAIAAKPADLDRVPHGQAGLQAGPGRGAGSRDCAAQRRRRATVPRQRATGGRRHATGDQLLPEDGQRKAEVAVAVDGAGRSLPCGEVV
jgi:cellulose synthase operon protein C